MNLPYGERPPAVALKIALRGGFVGDGHILSLAMNIFDEGEWWEDLEGVVCPGCRYETVHAHVGTLANRTIIKLPFGSLGRAACTKCGILGFALLCNKAILHLTHPMSPLPPILPVGARTELWLGEVAPRYFTAPLRALNAFLFTKAEIKVRDKGRYCG